MERMYIEDLKVEQKEKISKIIDYLYDAHKDAEPSLYYAPSTQIPTFKKNGMYVSVAGMKHYISVHFSKHASVLMVTKKHPRQIIALGACFNFVKLQQHATSSPRHRPL